MAFTDLLAAIALFVTAVKGMSALQMSRDLDCQYKTAFVMCHKLREAMANETAGFTLEGEVEIDGAYFGGSIKPENRKEDRIDRRLKEHQTGTRRVVIGLRQRAGRTLTFVRNFEHEGVQIARDLVASASTVFADEATHWDVLEAFFPTSRINHSEAYSEGPRQTHELGGKLLLPPSPHGSRPAPRRFAEVPRCLRCKRWLVRGSPPPRQRDERLRARWQCDALAGQPVVVRVLAAVIASLQSEH